MIRGQGLKPEIILYLVLPPAKAELHEILKKLGKNADEILRKGEDDYRTHFAAISKTG